MEGETKPSLNELIAEEIRVLLARRRLSASDLARMTGLTQRAISRRLTGEKVIDADDLERIAAAFGVDVLDLMPREGRLITVGGTSRPTTRGDLTTAHSPLAKRPGTHSSRGRALAPSKDRTGRIRANLVAA